VKRLGRKRDTLREADRQRVEFELGVLHEQVQRLEDTAEAEFGIDVHTLSEEPKEEGPQ
jgi:hypothetical protein